MDGRSGQRLADTWCTSHTRGTRWPKPLHHPRCFVGGRRGNSPGHPAPRRAMIGMARATPKASKVQRTMPKWFLGFLGLVLLLAFLSLVISPRNLCGDRGSDTRAKIVCPMFF